MGTRKTRDLPARLEKLLQMHTLELENAGGVKMRVQLRSTAMPDLAAISQTFWNRQP